MMMNRLLCRISSSMGGALSSSRGLNNSRITINQSNTFMKATMPRHAHEFSSMRKKGGNNNYKKAGNKSEAKVPINNRIRATMVRLIGPEGEAMGNVSLHNAKSKASRNKLDLVQLSKPNASPVVVKMMDYAKAQYDAKRAEKRKRQAAGGSLSTGPKALKEVTFMVSIEEGDKQTKVKQSISFLEKGHPVKVTLKWHRRIEGKIPQGMQAFDNILHELKRYGVLPTSGKVFHQRGRFKSTILSPIKKKAPPHTQKQIVENKKNDSAAKPTVK